MIYNNLNRVKGILSAQQGAQVPKYSGGAKFKLPYKGVTLYSIDKESWFTDEACSNPFTMTESDEFRSALSNVQYMPQNIDLSMKIPGGLEATPYTAAEDAARHNEISKQVVDEMIAERRAAAVQLPEVTVTAKNPNNPRSVPLLTTTQAGGGQPIDVSAGMKTVNEKLAKVDQNKADQLEKAQKWGQVGQAASQGIQMIGNAFAAKQAATDSDTTKTADSLYNGVADIASSFGPVGQAIGTSMKIMGAAGNILQELGSGTDQMTKTDQWMDSAFFSWNIGALNGALGKESNSFGIDQSIIESVGSSYGGSVDNMMEAEKTAGKKYGLFSSKARKKANTAIAKAATQQNLMGSISDDATDQRLAVQSMGEQAGLAYSLMTDGGYSQKYTYAAKQGGLLEWNPVIELEWEPQIELNWELPALKKGGNIDINEELEWIPEFKDGGKTEESQIPEIEETAQKNVIPEGALHKNKHHMEHSEGLTKKGIPVVDGDGEQQAEIEHSEIIFTLEVTKKLEEYYEIFYSEESTNKEKEQAALDAGKLLVYQILENTEDRTGLIESCKKGGTLTFKKDTEDLIEEVLEWMPTVVVIEETNHEKLDKKDYKKSEEKSEIAPKEEIKQMLKEVLIELLLK